MKRVADGCCPIDAETSLKRRTSGTFRKKLMTRPSIDGVGSCSGRLMKKERLRRRKILMKDIKKHQREEGEKVRGSSCRAGALNGLKARNRDSTGLENTEVVEELKRRRCRLNTSRLKAANHRSTSTLSKHIGELYRSRTHA